MIDILAITGLFHPSKLGVIIRKEHGIAQYAADVFQKHMLRGLLNTGQIRLSVLNSLFVSAYPSYSDIYISGEIINDDHYYEFRDMSFLNLPVVRLLCRELSLKSSVNYLIKKRAFDAKIILVYSLHSPFLASAIYAKSINPKIKICLVIPDLPQYMSNNGSFLYRGLKKMEEWRIRSLLKNIDACVVLTDHMVSKLKLNAIPFIRIEGIASESEDIIEPSCKKKGIVLYSGTLAKRYGVCQLVDAFRQVKNMDAQLWIIGRGDSESYINVVAQKDTRIKLFGQLPNEDVKRLQREATLLVNPRTNEGEYTQYSFPSKIIEYFSSGTPVLLHKLSGVPDEYYNHCFVFEDGNLETMAKALDKYLSLSESELAEKGKKARMFVLNEKNETIQGAKLCNFLMSLLN